MKGSERAAFPEERATALERLMQEYGTKVLHLAYYQLKDRQLAEDVAQEVFIKAYQHWDSFRGESSAYTWLYRITINLCRDKVRSAWWRRLTLTAEPRADAPGGLDQPAPPDDDPAEAVILSDRRERVLQFVMRLPDAYREVVSLYYYQDLSTGEIASVTGQNENTVKTRLFRARAMLKEAMAKGGAQW